MMLSLFMKIIFLSVLIFGFSDQAYSQEIFTAVINRDISKVQSILDADKEAVNLKKGNGNTPLHIAADNGYLDIVKLLISFGADIDNKNNGNRSPLFYAMRSNHMDIVNVLVDKGAEMTLKEAAACGFTELIEQQIAEGIDPNTLLHSAAFGGQNDIVDLLIKNGADVNLKDDNAEFTPIFYAIINNHEEIIDKLIRNGAELNIKDKNGDSPLDVAKAIGNDRVISKLTDLGAKTTLGPEANIHKLSENIYVVNFSFQNKPNIIVLDGGRTSLLIDTGFGRNVERLANTLKELGIGPLKYIINTHLHEDHTGGNALFKDDIEIIHFNNLKDLESKGKIENLIKEFDSGPSDYFPFCYSMKFDFEDILFIPVAGTHSASDMIVWIKNSNVIALGDILLPAYFQKETENYDEFIKRRKKTITSKGFDHLTILDKLINSFSDSTLFIGGHGDQFKMDEIKKYYELAKSVLNSE
jgi:ankyrin repeat protein